MLTRENSGRTDVNLLNKHVLGKHVSRETCGFRYEPWHVSPITRSYITACSRLFLPSLPFVNVLPRCLRASQKSLRHWCLFLAYLQSLDIMFRHTPNEERGKWTVVSALNSKQPASLAHGCNLSCPRWPGSANTGEPGLFSGWVLQAPGVFIEGSSKSATGWDGREEVSSTQWRQLMEKSRFHSSVLLQTHRLPPMKIYFGLYR